MDLSTIAKALSGFGGRNTINLESMLVEYLQERNKKVPLSPRFRDRIIARWLDEALEHLRVDMTPYNKETIIKQVCKDLFKEEELIAADVIITAASAREATRVSQRQQQLQEVSGLSRIRLAVMGDIHRARSEGQSEIEFKTAYYDDEEEVARLRTWLEKLGYEVEEYLQGYTVRWSESED